MSRLGAALHGQGVGLMGALFAVTVWFAVSGWWPHCHGTADSGNNVMLSICAYEECMPSHTSLHVLMC
jgi:hypothetical protein